MAPGRGLRPILNVGKSVALVDSKASAINKYDKRRIWLITDAFASQTRDLAARYRLDYARNVVNRDRSLRINEISTRDGKQLVSGDFAVSWRDQVNSWSDASIVAH